MDNWLPASIKLQKSYKKQNCFCSSKQKLSSSKQKLYLAKWMKHVFQMLYFDDPQQKHLYLTILLLSLHRSKRSGMFHSVALILSLGFLQHVIYIHTALLSLEGDCIVRNRSISIQNFQPSVSIWKYLCIFHCCPFNTPRKQPGL